ncbi:MAG: DUF4282 domain-containing protein [Phycisphaeraceae bacterium]|nr:DUF4282 domain-containing protein [Phycisphaeraceae bacterium]
MKDSLSFRMFSFSHFITPTLIRLLFIIGLLVIAVVGLVTIKQGVSASYGGGVMVLTGLFLLVLGPVAWRVVCELLILLFRMYDTLVEIEQRSRSGGGAAAKV